VSIWHDVVSRSGVTIQPRSRWCCEIEGRNCCPSASYQTCTHQPHPMLCRICLHCLGNGATTWTGAFLGRRRTTSLQCNSNVSPLIASCVPSSPTSAMACCPVPPAGRCLKATAVLTWGRNVVEFWCLHGVAAVACRDCLYPYLPSTRAIQEKSSAAAAAKRTTVEAVP
jgi:hypothetical protein